MRNDNDGEHLTKARVQTRVHYKSLFSQHTLLINYRIFGHREMETIFQRNTKINTKT